MGVLNHWSERRKIKELADLFVSKRTFLAGNWAMQRAQYGEQPDWALIVLASMIGQVGLSGGGFGFSMHYGGNAQASSGARIVPMISQGHNSVKNAIPASRISEAILNPDKEIDFMGKKLKLPKIKMIYNCGADLLGHEADTNELIRALRTLDCVIVMSLGGRLRQNLLILSLLPLALWKEMILLLEGVILKMWFMPCVRW
ncbi:hypothetical protein AOH226_12700 [Helicobacter pylori]